MGSLKGNTVPFPMQGRTTTSQYGKGVYMQQPLRKRARREVVSYQRSLYCGILEAGVLNTAATYKTAMI
jgi:hypothetical protein